MEEMKESLEISAKTVEEAIEIALKQLGAGREEAEVKVLSKGRAGILGFGSEPARVWVRRLAPTQNVASGAIEVVSRLLSLMNVSATATIRSSPAGEDEATYIDIQGEDSGLLIGRRGETLAGIQFVVNVLMSRRLGERVKVVVDVEQYKERRTISLKALANRLAERVAATGRPITLEPMPSDERRIIHLALADSSHVTTQSVGDGEERKVSIHPKRDQPA